MPLIQCPGCRAVFDVALDVVGTDVDCPKCKTEFVAAVKRAGPRRKSKSSTPIMWAIAGVGLFAAILVYAANKGPSGTDSSMTSAASAATEGSRAEEAENTSSVAGENRDKDPMLRLVEEFLTAIQHGDDSDFLKMVSFSAMQDRLSEEGDAQPWRELDDIERTLARQAISEQLLGTESTREFLKTATPQGINVLDATEGQATVHVTFQSLLDDRRQEREIELIRIGSQWRIAGMTTGDVISPSKLLEQQEAKKERVRRSFYGIIEPVEYLPETTPEEKERIESLVPRMLDMTTGREASAARRELVDVGKSAIPALLNEIVSRKEMATTEQIQELNVIVQTLRDITFENMGFTPGAAAAGIMGESLEDNTLSLRKWFGWWRDHKDTWTGPQPVEPDEDD